MKLTRRVSFSSGHRYWLASLSEDENRALFGKWASPYSHGHNYVLEVSVAGKIDPENGMVINIKIIDDILKRNIVAPLDQKSLNDEVSHFATTVPTTENIGLYIRSQLKLPSEVKFVGLRLYEKPDLFIDVGETDTVTLTRGYEFSAAHRLHVPSLDHSANVELFGKCNNPAGHGHNYELEVSVDGIPDAQTGMIVDIESLDSVVHREVVDRYDHKHLNDDIEEFKGINPTTEVLTKTIWQRLDGKLPAKLRKVLIRETARNIFEYSDEDR